MKLPLVALSLASSVVLVALLSQDPLDRAEAVLRLGRFDEARATLQTVEESSLANVGLERLARTWGRFVEAKVESGEYTEALTAAEIVLRLRRTLHPRDHAKRALALNNVAACLLYLGRGDEALSRFEQALAMRKRLFGSDHMDVADGLNNVAACLNFLGRSDAALPKYEEAFAMRRRLSPGDLRNLALGLNNVAACLQAIGRNTEALGKFEAALAMRQEFFAEDHAAVAESLNNVGMCLESLGRSAEALRKVEDGLAMVQRLHFGDHPHVADSLNNVATCLDSLGRWAEALARCNEALVMQRRLFRGDHPGVARGLNNVGNLLDALGRSNEALAKFREALAMYERLFPSDHPSVATSVNNLASCLDSLGRSAEALPEYERALLVRRRLFTGDHPDVADSLNNMAMCRDSLGRSVEALPMFWDALAMRRRIYVGDHRDVADSLSNLAGCLQRVGRIAEALTMHDASLAMRRRLFADGHHDVATSLNNTAVCLELLGRNTEALSNHVEALGIWKRLFPGDHPTVATSLNNVASSLDAIGRKTEALRYYEQALAMQGRLFAGDHPALALSLNNIATCLSSVGRNREALARYDDALAMRRRLILSDHPAMVMSLANLARCRYEQGLDSNVTRALLEEAVEQVESMRSAANSLDQSDRAAFFAELRRADPYDLLRCVAVGLDDPIEALDISERSRSRELLDLLARGGTEPLKEAQRRAGLAGDEEGVASLLKLRADLAQAEAEQSRLFHEIAKLASDRAVADSARPVRRGMLTTSLEKAGNERRRLMRERARAIADLVPILDSAKPCHIQAALEPGELLLQYALDDDECHLFVVDRKEVEVVRLPSTLKQVTRQVDVARTSFGVGKAGTGRNGSASYEEKSPSDEGLFELGNAVLPEAVWERVRTARCVVVAPDGPLHRFPMDALVVGRDEDGSVVRWLDDGPPVASVPSGSVFSFLRQRKGASGRADDQYLLAVGDPEFRRDEEESDSAGDGCLEDRGERWRDSRAEFSPPSSVCSHNRFGDLEALPGTRQEVLGIEVSWSAAKGRVRTLLGPEATETNLFDLARKARILHLATHGRFDEVAGQSLSALALAIPQEPTPLDDGFLTLADLLSRWDGRLTSCEMVVLAACRTHLGVEQVDEAPMALSMGFLFAGAPTVVASLWKVDDTATALLMIRFYENLLGRVGKPMSKADALQDAKVWLRNMSRRDAETARRRYKLDLRRAANDRDGPEVAEGPRIPEDGATRPYARPYYWSAFVLVGNPQ